MSRALLGMQPTFRQVPPRVAFFSTHTVFMPSWAACVESWSKVQLGGQVEVAYLNCSDVAARSRSNDNKVHVIVSGKGAALRSKQV